MVKVFLIFAGNTLNTHAQFWQRLVRSTNAEEVANVRDCDVTLTFCPIVSRVGTDVEAAVQLIPTTRPGVLVLLHPTFNPEEIVPDASKFVRRADILTVNCLFHESTLLDSHCNDKAYEKVSSYLRGFAHTGYELPSPPQNGDMVGITRIYLTLNKAFERVSRYLRGIVSQNPHTGYERPSPPQNRNHGYRVGITVTLLGLSCFIIYLYLMPSLQDKPMARGGNSPNSSHLST